MIYTLLALFGLGLLWARFLPVFWTPYMLYETFRLGGMQHEWVPLEAISDHMITAVIAAEDSGFCQHKGVEWGVTWKIIQKGAARGGSTITQQMVKNVWLVQTRSYLRKALEIPLALLMDALYPKTRIMTLYLNVIEYDTGVFGIEAAAQHHFNIPARDLSPHQAALLAAVLPSPKRYAAVPPGSYVSQRARSIQAQMHDIRAQGLADCVLEP